MNPWLLILAGLALASGPAGPAPGLDPSDARTKQLDITEIGPYWPTEEDE